MQQDDHMVGRLRELLHNCGFLAPNGKGLDLERAAKILSRRSGKTYTVDWFKRVLYKHQPLLAEDVVNIAEAFGRDVREILLPRPWPTPRPLARPIRYQDLTGRVSGRLTVIEPLPVRQRGCLVWLCECSCPGRTRIVVKSTNLIQGNVRSCGCLKSESSAENLARYRRGLQSAKNRLELDRLRISLEERSR